MTSCASKEKDVIETIKSNSYITMATNAEFEPFEFKAENKIVGICRYRFGDFYKNQYDSVDCELCALYVKPELKRNGIGKCLVNYVMNDFRQNGCFKMILWCFKDNFPSRAFYESLDGFYCGEKIIVKGNKEYKEVAYVFELK